MIPKRLLKRLSVKQLREAIRIKAGMQKVENLERKRDQLLRQARQLDRKIARLSGGNGSVATPRKRRRRKMSAETRRRMSEAAKRRYAKAKGTAPAASGKPARRKMSAETRAKMAAAARSRWAKVAAESKAVSAK
jgi:sugar phosphate isomerase/epimerase